MEDNIESLNQILVRIDNLHHHVVEARKNFAKEMNDIAKLLYEMQKRKKKNE